MLLERTMMADCSFSPENKLIPAAFLPADMISVKPLSVWICDTHRRQIKKEGNVPICGKSQRSQLTSRVSLDLVNILQVLMLS